MLDTANDFDFYAVMYEFNKLKLDSENNRDIENVNCAFYYHTKVLH